MSKIKAIISDADGTLINTLYLIRRGQYEAVMDYLVEGRLPRQKFPSYKVYERYLDQNIGGTTRETFEATLGRMLKEGVLDPELTPELDFDEIDRRLRPIQDRIAPLYVHPFYGLHEMLSWVGKSGLGFAIFTGGSNHHVVRNFGVALPCLGYTDLFRMPNVGDREKRESFLERVQAVYGIRNLALVTCDDVEKTKPDPEAILKALKNLGVAADEAVVLGNHVIDVQTATAAGMKVIGLSHGFGTPEELKKAGAVQVVDSLSEVMELIENHNNDSATLW